MKRISHEEMIKLLPHYYNTGQCVVVVGRTGIGKSTAIREFAQKVAAEKKKEFIDMGDVNSERLNEILSSPDKYFVMKIVSLSTIGDPSDLRGIPFSEDNAVLKSKVVKWLKNEWLCVFEKCEGALFLDEFNLSPPSIQSCIYQLMLDKRIDDIKFREGVGVFAAGNMSEDKAGVYEIAKPVRTRGGMFELQNPDHDAWVDWASKHNINGQILCYISKFPARLFVENEKTDDIVSPRSWESVSRLLEKCDGNLDTIELLSSGYLGEGMASEFVSFIKLSDKVPKPEDILSGKAKVPEEIDLKYACIAQIIELYRQKKSKRNDLVKQIVALEGKIDPEFYIKMMRMVRGIDVNPIKGLLGTPHIKPLAKYSKFLLD